MLASSCLHLQLSVKLADHKTDSEDEMGEILIDMTRARAVVVEIGFGMLFGSRRIL